MGGCRFGKSVAPSETRPAGQGWVHHGAFRPIKGAARPRRSTLRVSCSSQEASSTRRLLLAGTATVAGWGLASPLTGRPLTATADELEVGSPPDTTITDKVYLDIGIAATAFKPAGERTLGDKTVLPDESTPAGRIVLGLYGKAAPATVANFLAVVRQGALTGTSFSRISPGEYIQAGRQGSRRLGELEGLQDLQSNADLSTASAFKLPLYSPGTLALSLSENDEEPNIKDRTGYRNVEFLITTGPGPVPRLNGLNVVFGKVLQGMDTVAAVAGVPSFQPDIRSQQLNRFAAFLGDERADNVRRRYGRPLKAVIITGSGVVEEGDGSSSRSSST